MYLVGDYVGFRPGIELDPEFDGELVLANLEGPYSSGEGKIKPNKAGPRVWNEWISPQPKWCFSLANNHMMDFGADGLRETTVRLRERGIPFAGAGDNQEASRKAMVVEENGKKIGIISMAERQFGMAEDGVSGIAGMGLWVVDAIRQLRKSVDFVIVSCHAAVEMSPIPSPEIREFYKFLIDHGADLIHGHHAHVPQGWEEYKGGYIFYGLGNFLVDPNEWSEPNTLWSLVVRMDFTKDKPHATVIPAFIEQKESRIKVELRNEVAGNEYIAALNSIFFDEMLYRGAWQTVCVDLFHSLYENNMGFYPIDQRSITLRDWLKRIYHTARTLLAFLLHRNGGAYSLVQYNYMQCESHLQLQSEAMGVQLGVRKCFINEDSKALVGRLLSEMEICVCDVGEKQKQAEQIPVQKIRRFE